MGHSNKNNLLLLVILTIIFSFLIFITKSYFFSDISEYELNQKIEKYIEPHLESEFSYTDVDLLNTKIEEKILETLNSAYKLRFSFFPSDFIKEEKAKEYYDLLDTFFDSDYIIDKISFLEIYLFKDKWVTRWKMNSGTVKLFWIYEMTKEEFLSVAIHEFWHFLDIYFLKKSVDKDVSDYFYDLSWDSTTVIKAWQQQKDFVSWYAMTNKYEDFSESFTYYVLHNLDFREKAKESDLLLDKYIYFEKYLFRNDEFKTDSFKTTTQVKDYYRDITKVWFSLENFLQYLKK